MRGNDCPRVSRLRGRKAPSGYNWRKARGAGDVRRDGAAGRNRWLAAHAALVFTFTFTGLYPGVTSPVAPTALLSSV